VKRVLAQERVVLHQFHAPGRVPAVLRDEENKTRRRQRALETLKRDDVARVDASRLTRSRVHIARTRASSNTRAQTRARALAHRIDVPFA
jgi:hypothetical protein